uniref:Uncharacterized protein n=1 Tax=Arundo donax TaxID=35708 RepID=A0A0A8YHI0_ARUDO
MYTLTLHYFKSVFCARIFCIPLLLLKTGYK